MTLCAHCEKPIERVTFNNGEGWMHSDGQFFCPPVTHAEPMSDLRTTLG